MANIFGYSFRWVSGKGRFMNGPRNTFNHGFADQLKDHAQSAVSSVQSPALGNCTTGLSFSELHSLRPEFDSPFWHYEAVFEIAAPAHPAFAHTWVFRWPVEYNRAGRGGRHGSSAQDNRGAARRRGKEK
jgi:hypothetical protein